ncbi:MAG: TIM barrel protein [Provencibacterium sp.]|jgi:deoxyribonuclease-4|nr:TIM barrel protein [Provencibacterium sp.]
MSARFGPAGNSESFRKMGYKKTLDVPDYLVKMGLNHYEYQCGRGVRISEEQAKAFGEKSREQGISLSLHAPYYISLSGIEEEKRLGSIEYILQSVRAAKAMGAQRVVVHSGSCAKLSREAALELSKDTLRRALEALDAEGLGNVALCPETMGKTGQLGTLEEVLELCKTDDRLIPCIDFGHLYARTFGALNGSEGYEKILTSTRNALGEDRMRVFHSHFSRIAFTETGGEKMHLTFADEEFGPEYPPLLEWIDRWNLSPIIVCESAGTQAEDAKAMKEFYEQLHSPSII